MLRCGDWVSGKASGIAGCFPGGEAGRAAHARLFIYFTRQLQYCYKYKYVVIKLNTYFNKCHKFGDIHIGTLKKYRVHVGQFQSCEFNLFFLPATLNQLNAIIRKFSSVLQSWCIFRRLSICFVLANITSPWHNILSDGTIERHSCSIIVTWHNISSLGTIFRHFGTMFRLLAQFFVTRYNFSHLSIFHHLAQCFVTWDNLSHLSIFHHLAQCFVTRYNFKSPVNISSLGTNISSL